MKKSLLSLLVAAVFIITAFCFAGFALADKQPSEPKVIKLEGAKLPPVNFSHKTHVEKHNLECAKCHHKDTNPKEPDGCVKCHPVAGAKNNAPVAKDAFHKMCIDCHKDSSAKGVKAPAACNECHKK